ncbi:MAG: FAD-dependent oxidoreductase [Bradymonadales bacterium]|nr:FAD-dependent oxidoreductase [Bradymonadales bacterium]
MDVIDTLVIGAGITGLAYASFTPRQDLLVLEAEDQIGGYCKTVRQGPFVWDYSGHFFHFRHPHLERYLVSQMIPGEVQTITKWARILFEGTLVDFPFQKNIHQLPKEDFIDCLYELFFREERPVESFQDMLLTRFGSGICRRFLFPYNEKLYACDLDRLDVDAMGRFFPHADLAEIIRNFKFPNNRSYNTTFTYPRSGAVAYIDSLKSRLPDDRISLNEPLLRIDLEHKVAQTNQREIAFSTLVCTTPFNRLLEMTGIEHEPGLFTSNKVLVFNLGFDTKGPTQIHWMYLPEPRFCFYRVGFYDNIFGSPQMSLYIEIGLPTSAAVDVPTMQDRVLNDLKTAGIVGSQRLIASHNVVLDPAYVHITSKSQQAVASLKERLARHGVYSIGRYGSWTYCSIEDNLVEALQLVERLEGKPVRLA